jgi:pectate lyase
VNQALELAVVFSERNECTRENPVQVQVGEGNHEMWTLVDVLGSTTYHIPVDCNNVTIVGKGKGKTTILGGFGVNGKQNVKIQQLSARNIAGHGLDCRNGATVDVTECCFKSCRDDGMHVRDGATVTATQCEFMENGGRAVFCLRANTKVRLNDCKVHHNGMSGLLALNDAVVDVHGTKTDIHSNKCGIGAGHRGKVNIHLPSQHNTSHDNVREDRTQVRGGSIANINADGTFTHVEEVDYDDY